MVVNQSKSHKAFIKISVTLVNREYFYQHDVGLRNALSLQDAQQKSNNYRIAKKKERKQAIKPN